jgi:hypothetical protein
VTTAGPDLGDKARCGDPESEGESSSSSELSPASAQNRDPRQTWLSGSGERGEGGAPAVTALGFFVAFESPGGRERPAPTVIFSPPSIRNYTEKLEPEAVHNIRSHQYRCQI